jgi:hypothetical protein
MVSLRHEQVYHAAQSCQAASLSLTTLSLRGLFWVCQIESQKNEGFLARVKCGQHELRWLGNSWCMLLLGLFKGSPFIGCLMPPDGKDDPDPHISQRTYRHGVAFALISFALVIVESPRFTARRLPGKLLQRIAQRLDTPHSTMHFSIFTTGKLDGRGPRQCLQARCIGVALPIVANFGQEPWCQPLACSGQTGKDLVVRMHQKKGLNLLIIGSNLLQQGQKLGYQYQHQSRFGTRCDCISSQLRVMGLLDNRVRSGFCPRVSCLSQTLCDLLTGGRLHRLQGGIALQEEQRRALLQLAKQTQCNGIIRFQAGGELIDQPRLHLDQAILIAGELLEFFNCLTVGYQPTQVNKISTSGPRQQVGINTVCFGSDADQPYED